MLDEPFVAAPPGLCDPAYSGEASRLCGIRDRISAPPELETAHFGLRADLRELRERLRTRQHLGRVLTGFRRHEHDPEIAEFAATAAAELERWDQAAEQAVNGLTTFECELLAGLNARIQRRRNSSTSAAGCSTIRF